MAGNAISSAGNEATSLSAHLLLDALDLFTQVTVNHMLGHRVAFVSAGARVKTLNAPLTACGHGGTLQRHGLLQKGNLAVNGCPIGILELNLH
jgi:hypothetical protein